VQGRAGLPGASERGLFFPVEDDIPNFILEDAHPLEMEEGKGK
jgi:uncharacterized protein YbaR (Trm112 family)